MILFYIPPGFVVRRRTSGQTGEPATGTRSEETNVTRNFKIWHPDALRTKLKFGNSKFKTPLKTFTKRKRTTLNIHTGLSASSAIN